MPVIVAMALGGCFGEAPGGEGDTGTTTASTSSGGPTTDETTATSTEPTSSATTSATTSTTLGTDTTSADTTTSESTDPTTTESSSTTDTGVDAPTFFDDFERADSQALGNNWVEKLPSVFAIVEGTVAAETATPQQYFDQVVYQLDNVVDDIELRVEFRVGTAADGNEPHLVARQQADALASGSFNHCYILVPQPPQNRLCLMRFDSEGGIGETSCAGWPNANLVLDDWYRLVMTVAGPGPVDLTGRLEHSVGGEWVEVVAVQWLDQSPNRIDTAGSWGFSGGTTGLFFTNYVFDNFTAYYHQG